MHLLDNYIYSITGWIKIKNCIITLLRQLLNKSLWIKIL